MMRGKLGLRKSLENDSKLINGLDKVLQLTETDMTLFFRNLAKVKKSPSSKDKSSLEFIWAAFYKPEEVKESISIGGEDWLSDYRKRLQFEKESDSARNAKMDRINPKYVLRNYMAQLAIDEADKGDYKILNELHTMLKKPYDEQPENEKWFAKRPEWARNKVGCSMLSCSS
jgi:uncharacterized protein YdiU (UPF0061 family)